MASVASTYARAFADVVFDAHLDADRAVGGLNRIISLLAESADLRRVWDNPAVPADQKRSLLDAIVQREEIEHNVRNLVAVLIDHQRLPFLGQIVEQLKKELDARMGFVADPVGVWLSLNGARAMSLRSSNARAADKRDKRWT